MAEEQALDEGTDFEEHRRYLSAVAYRLLGSLADAEDAVQDAWLRWRSTDRSTVRDPRAFLTTVVTRICYDLLGSARVRREAYYGEWLPEPVVGSAVGIGEIAETLGRTPEAARQLASRGRRRIRERTTQRTLDRAEHRKAVAAFAAATAHGDIPGLMAVLDPQVVWHSDGGGIVRAGIRPVVTAERVARLIAGLTDRWFTSPELNLSFHQVDVNGAPSLSMLDGDGAAMGVISFEVVDGRITAAYAMVNPEKLGRVAGGAVSPHLPRR